MTEPADAPSNPARPRSGRVRLAIAVAAVAVLVAAFLVLRSRGSGDEPRPAAVPQADHPTTGATPAPGGTGASSAPAPAPAVPVVRIRGGEPVGGVRRLTATKGERIRFAVVSDAPGEVHLHGYDVERELTPGRHARFDLKATLEGRFDVELHGTDTQVARVDVTP